MNASVDWSQSDENSFLFAVAVARRSRESISGVGHVRGRPFVKRLFMKRLFVKRRFVKRLFVMLIL